jgi:hypothetical protein
MCISFPLGLEPILPFYRCRFQFIVPFPPDADARFSNRNPKTLHRLHVVTDCPAGSRATMMPILPAKSAREAYRSALNICVFPVYRPATQAEEEFLAGQR